MTTLSFYKIISNFIFAFVSTLSFGILFNVKGNKVIAASIGGGLGWIVYILLYDMNISKIVSIFIATIVISVYSEIIARVMKQPVTMFAISAIIPLVPGSGMYYTMYEVIQGNNEKASLLGMETFVIACSIASGITLVSSITKLINPKLGRKKRI
ncbi:threonine/serine exporter family protein [Clostridium grantii]|uniref:Uncharacterized membrane protein YjjB, DUF3815 family n=1 Tax=Clostridium grantii DSM 8605 TaxID=1121316 RepID=A0A1M5QLH7_9CLOT|nr:threonine/serine exporter family protein [Clostridium grantii]SHH14806.1 Uncharacterized membrane protein YjjB, DUF3815 family [Clostridium grantii DSM 8605]